MHYGLVLCIFQLYRVFLLPFANTWMLYSLIDKLQVSISSGMCMLQGFLLGSCFFLSIRMRALLHVPVQLVSVCFSASVASKVCPASGTLPMVTLCMSSVLSLQLALGVAVPMLISFSCEAGSCRSFVPHVQAKRALFHA